MLAKANITLTEFFQVYVIQVWTGPPSLPKSILENPFVSEGHAVEIVTQNPGHGRFSYLVQLSDCKPCLVVISLIPKSVTMAERRKLL